MKICSAIINLFHLIPAAPQTLVKPLLEVVMKTERAMLIEVARFQGLYVCVRLVFMLSPVHLCSEARLTVAAEVNSPWRILFCQRNVKRTRQR